MSSMMKHKSELGRSAVLSLCFLSIGCQAEQTVAASPGANLTKKETDCSGIGAALEELEAAWDENSMTKVVERFGECPADLVFRDVMSAAEKSSGDPGPNRENVSKAMNAGFVVELAKRGYGLFENDAAMQTLVVADYQRSIGDEVSGVLTFKQASQIMEMMEQDAKERATAGVWLNAGSLAFEGSPDEPEVFHQPGYLSFEGAWWIEGDDKIGVPLNVSKYRCDLRTEECVEAELSVMQFSSDELMVDANLNWYRVTSAKHPIYKIEPVGFAGCRVSEITVNVDRNEVFQITTQRSDCDTVDDLKAPRVSRLRSAAWQSKEVREQADLVEEQSKSPQLRALLKSVEEDFQPAAQAE